MANGKPWRSPFIPTARSSSKRRSAPLVAEVEKRILRRAGWIKRQLDYFRQFDPRTPERRYVGGESHLYMGRQYRLKISRGATEGVKLSGGYFHIGIKEQAPADRVKALLQAWYADKAAGKFQESMERCWPAFAKLSLAKPRLQLRRMRKRWGSLSEEWTADPQHRSDPRPQGMYRLRHHPRAVPSAMP